MYADEDRRWVGVAASCGCRSWGLQSFGGSEADLLEPCRWVQHAHLIQLLILPAILQHRLGQVDVNSEVCGSVKGRERECGLRGWQGTATAT